MDGVTNVESGLSEVSPQIEVAIDDQRATEAGLQPAQVPTAVGALLGGVPDIEAGDETVSVGVPDGSVDSVDEVRDLPIGSGANVSDVAEVSETEAPAAIGRSDTERAVTVAGEITAQDSGAVSTEVSELVADLDLPGDVEAQVGGESEDIAESFRDILIAIAVALILVYLVLVVFFSSLTVPLVILLSVPLITSGAFGALLITGTAISLPALLGILLLIGIVVANAILLVDFAQNARERHSSLDEALVEAGRERLRPILMTALATIFALVPLATGISFFTEGGGGGLISSSLAIPVLGGLVTSTLLTLLVVPVAYSLLKDGRRKKSGGDGPPHGEPEDRDQPAAAEPEEISVGVSTGAPTESPNGSSEAPAAGALDVREASRERQDELLFELGRAMGRAEVLERELERRQSELSENRNGSGPFEGLLRRLGR